MVFWLLCFVWFYSFCLVFDLLGVVFVYVGLFCCVIALCVWFWLLVVWLYWYCVSDMDLLLFNFGCFDCACFVLFVLFWFNGLVACVVCCSLFVEC